MLRARRPGLRLASRRFHYRRPRYPDALTSELRNRRCPVNARVATDNLVLPALTIAEVYRCRRPWNSLPPLRSL